MKDVKRIASFSVDHDLIGEGIYLSRVDGDISTYDLRTRRPNMGDYMDNVTMHSVEHMFATYIRNSEVGGDVIYFGPMGCRTGFYLLLRGEDYKRALTAVIDTLRKIVAHTGEMFGATRKECGNYIELDVEKARAECKRYLDILLSKENDFKYPET